MSNPPDDGCVPGSRREVVGGLRPRWHRYTSTACRHHPHVASERCRVTCKFCAAACACYCHTGGPVVAAAGQGAAVRDTASGEPADGRSVG